MDNKLFGMIFAAILSCAVLVFGVANAGAYAIDNWVFPIDEFGDNTYIGVTDVSNMEVPAAKMLLAGQTETWRTDAELFVVYQDATEPYPLQNAEILLDETLGGAKTGAQNNFVFKLSTDTTKKFLADRFPVVTFSQADVAAINQQLEQALQAGQTKTIVSISRDSLVVERENVADVVFPVTVTSDDSTTLIDALNGIQLAPGTQFSFLEFISELPLNKSSDEELTQIASTIYGALLQTNFLIDERSIGSTLPAQVPAGQEAAINRRLGIDLVFTNPNESSFILNLTKAGNSLNASLNGLPFVYTYAIDTIEEKTIEPRLIKQYSAFVTSGNQVEEKGIAGKSLTVRRSVLADGREVKVQTVSTDFYPPVYRVEIYPLVVAKAPEPTAPVAGEPGFVDANGDGIHDGTTTAAPKAGEPGFVDANGDGVHDSTSSEGTVPTSGEPGFIDNNKDGVHDKPETETPEKNSDNEQKKPVYDKAGNLVTE